MNIGAVLAIWLLLAVFAVCNGVLREKVWRRWFVDTEAHAISTLIGSAAILVACFAMIDWMSPDGLAGAWAIGGVWILLTLAFEFLAGHYLFGNPWVRLLADYNALKGRVWWLVIACTFIGPPMAFRGFDVKWALPYSVSLALAITILALAYRKPAGARSLVALLFAYACVHNGRLALTDPTPYRDFSLYALVPALESYIRGPFARHASSVILAIAIGQGVIALAMALAGRFLWVGVVGCAIFLTAIIPLGVGSAFPFSAIVTLATLIVLSDHLGYSGVPGKTTSFKPK